MRRHLEASAASFRRHPGILVIVVEAGGSRHCRPTMDHEELVELDAEERGAEATTTSPSSSLLSEGDVINTQLNSLSSNKFLWLVVMFAAMGGLLFGYDIGAFSSSSPPSNIRALTALNNNV